MWGRPSVDTMKGTLPEIARWQGTEINDWRDEQPSKMLHEAHDRPTIMLNMNPRRCDYEVLDKRGTLHVLPQPSPWSLTASFAERLKDALTSMLPGR